MLAAASALSSPHPNTTPPDEAGAAGAAEAVGAAEAAAPAPHCQTNTWKTTITQSVTAALVSEAPHPWREKDRKIEREREREQEITQNTGGHK